mgnify:FL=1
MLDLKKRDKSPFNIKNIIFKIKLAKAFIYFDNLCKLMYNVRKRWKMSHFVYYVVALVCAASLICAGILLNKKSEKAYKIFLIVASSLVAAVFLVRYMYGSDAIENMLALGGTPFPTKAENFFAIFLVWFSYSSALLLSLYGFFKVKFLNNFIKFFAFPVSLLSLCFMKFHFTAIIGENAINEYSVRGFIFAAEIGLVFGFSLLVLILKTNWKNVWEKLCKGWTNFVSFFKKETWKLKKEKRAEKKAQKALKKEEKKAIRANAKKKTFAQVWDLVWEKIKWFFSKYWFPIFAVIIVLFSLMPAYTFQGLFGFIHQTALAKSFELPHRIILYIGIILPFIIHFSLRKEEFSERKFYLLFICLGTLITFSLHHKFQSFLDPVNWPLHLCNTAMYIMPIVLIFKMKRFFYFTYFINVVGAFFAMFMPNYSESLNMFSTRILIFYTNHYIAFFMPILFVSLGMFNKPKFKQFVYSMLGFLGYFILVLVLNAMFTGLHEVGLASAATDFFFINSDFIADKLGEWCVRLMDIKWVIPVGRIKMTFYPVYQVIFFIVYIGIGFAMWFIYEQAYDIARNFEDMRQRKKAIKLERLALEAKVGGRSLKEPMEKENENKLILRNFSKKYGTSNVYAVKDANLEVQGGEIFGFLGPNGAGKSTIIKTVVGIQPITSGEIVVCGYDVKNQSVEAKKQIGFVPDHYALYEKLTGREYINYIADLYEVSLEDRNKRIDEYVKRFELETAFDNQMKTYSHGMKQKIAIMSALVHDPKVWILDEPLTGLDPNSIFQVKECMKEHAKKGNIVFFSSHIIDVVERICDRIAIIKKGTILTCKSVKEIEESGVSLEQFYMDTIEQHVDVQVDEPKQEETLEEGENKKERKFRRRDKKSKKSELKA